MEDALEAVFGDFVIWPAFLYAGMIFMLFKYLQNELSSYANDSIKVWLTSRSYNADDAKFVTLEIFDKLYGYPLNRISSFIRSSIISLFVTSIVVYVTYKMTFVFIFTRCCGVAGQFSIQFLSNVILDYLSLFIVRSMLSRSMLISGVFLGPFLGIIVVIFGYTIVDVAIFSFQTWTFHPIYFLQGLTSWIYLIGDPEITSRKSILLGAIFVHAWLPLFALGALFTKLINVLRKATLSTEKFVKDGENEPLRVLGYIISAITFVVASALIVLV